jgi:hypothetical protein
LDMCEKLIVDQTKMFGRGHAQVSAAMSLAEEVSQSYTVLSRKQRMVSGTNSLSSEKDRKDAFSFLVNHQQSKWWGFFKDHCKLEYALPDVEFLEAVSKFKQNFNLADVQCRKDIQFILHHYIKSKRLLCMTHAMRQKVKHKMATPSDKMFDEPALMVYHSLPLGAFNRFLKTEQGINYRQFYIIKTRCESEVAVVQRAIRGYLGRKYFRLVKQKKAQIERNLHGPVTEIFKDHLRTVPADAMSARIQEWLKNIRDRKNAYDIVRKLLAKQFQKLFDEENNAYYYWNKKDGSVSWVKPKLLKDGDDIFLRNERRVSFATASIERGPGVQYN